MRSDVALVLTAVTGENVDAAAMTIALETFLNGGSWNVALVVAATAW